jgi:hypothetical protein
MRKQLFTIAMLGLFLALVVASVHAQSQRAKILATIPFDFTAGGKDFKAGAYTVKLISQHVLLLRSADGKTNAIVLAPQAIAEETNQSERMVFHCYGNRYFLAQVWVLRTDIGRELYPSKAEHALMKEGKPAKAKPQTVQVAAAAQP